jgi:PAS domain S-box-containing protein
VPDGAFVNLLELLVGSVVDYAIVVLDVDGRISSWNPGAELLKGYRADEVIGRHFSIFYTDDDIEDRFPDRELAIAGAAGRFENEGWRVRKDGSRFWANVVITALRDADGRLVGFGKVTRDLTERKRAEDALRESEERFRLLVGGVSDYAIFMLDPDGRVSSWNLGVERLKGYRADELLGRHFSLFYTEEDQRSGLPAIGLREAEEKGRWENEGWRVRKDGSRFWADVIITALRGADGQLRGFAKVTRDLTDRKQGEDALRGIAERDRAAADQLRSIDAMRRELVTMVAHDLRGPVSVTQHLLDLLLDQWDELDDAQRRRKVEQARRRTQALGTLTDDVFDIALIDSGRLEVAAERMDVSAIVRRAASDVLPSDDSDRIRLTVADGVHAVGDEKRTWQVLTNLFSNALKYGTGDGPVEVWVDRSGQQVMIGVLDTGPGIAPQDQERIFDRYTRLASADGTPGSGMGLFIARSLVEAQGGTITVSSSEGAGATFWVALPAA